MYVAKCFHRGKKEKQPPPDSTTNLVARVASRWDNGEKEDEPEEEPKNEEEIKKDMEEARRLLLEQGKPPLKKTKSATPLSDGEATTSHDDLIPFYKDMDIYLKPIYSIKIKVVLPRMRHAQMGQSISNWELKEKIKKLALPVDLSNMRVSQSTLEEVEFVTSLPNNREMKQVVKNLNETSFKALGFPEKLKLIVEEGTSDFPTRVEWDKFFREQEDMDERVPGERPDTVYIGGLPHDWFQPKKGLKELEDIFDDIMGRYGDVRKIDIPQADPLRKQMDQEISGLRMSWWTIGSEPFFEVYIQYIEYKGFVNAMQALHGKQIVRKRLNGTFQEATLKVDFDRTKHLTDKKILLRSLKRSLIKQQDYEIRQKEKLRDRDKDDSLEKRQKEQQKIARRILREEKRRQKLEKLKHEAFLRKKLKKKRNEAKDRRKGEARRLLEYVFDYQLKKLDAKAKEEQAKNVMNQLSHYILQNGLDDEESLRERMLKGKELKLREKMATKAVEETEPEILLKKKGRQKGEEAAKRL